METERLTSVFNIGGENEKFLIMALAVYWSEKLITSQKQSPWIYTDLFFLGYLVHE